MHDTKLQAIEFASLNQVEKQSLKDQFQNVIVDENSCKIITGFKGGKLASPIQDKMLNGYYFLLQREKSVFQLIPQVFSNNYHILRILESLAGCRTMVISAVFCTIGALERNVY